MSTEDIKHFDFYDMRAACRKYKDQDIKQEKINE